MSFVDIDFLLRHGAILALLLPLSAALGAAFLPSGRLAWAGGCAAIALMAGLAILVALRVEGTLASAMGGWGAPLGVEWRIDGLSAFGLAIAASLAALGFSAALGPLRGEIEGARQPLAVALALAVVAGVAGIIAAGDFYTIFALTLWIWIGLAALTALGVEHDRRAGPAALQVLLHGSIASLLFAFGAGLLFLSTGALDAKIAAGVLNAAQGRASASAGLALMLTGAALLAGLAPMNSWAVAGFSRGPGFASLCFGVVVPVAGAVLLARLMALAASANAPGLLAGVSVGLSALGALSAVIGSAQALAAGDLRRLALHLMAVQGGCVAIGFSSATALGISGGLFHLVSQSIAVFVLLATASALRAPRGAGAPLSLLDGLGKRAPGLSAAIVVAFLSLVGAPMTAGFLSRWALLQAALAERLWWGAAAIIVASLAAAAYAAQAIERIYLRPAPSGAPAPRIAAATPGLMLAVIVTIFFGFAGDAALRAAETAAASLSWVAR